jgi:clan AA aspartic protease (TIGR02281 family)
MRSRLGVPTLLVLCLVLPTACPASAERASDVIEKAIRAHGGREALTEIEDSGVRTGTLYTYGATKNEARFIMFSRGERTRVDLDMAGIMVTAVFDGDGGWMRSQGQVVSLSERQRKEQERLRTHDLAKLAEYDSEGYKTAYLGRSDHEGRTLEGVAITDPNGTTTQFYLDPETWLVARIAYEDVNLDTQEWARHEARLSDYRSVGGVPTPFRLEAYVNGEVIQAMQFAMVDISAPVPEDIFARPGAADHGESAVPSTPVTVPCEFTDDKLILDVSINGAEPARFLVDTGAGITIVDSGYAQQLGLQTSGRIEAAAAGGSVAGQVTTLDTIRIGEVELKNVQALVLNLNSVSGVRGILGFNFLNRFATTIDYAGNTITLANPHQPISPAKGAHVIAMDVDSETPHVKARLDGTIDLDMVVDTGAALTIVPYRVLRDLAPTETTDAGVASGTDGKDIRMRQMRLRTMEIGDLVIRDVAVVAPAEQDTGDPTGSTVQSSGGGTLGNPTLKRFRVTLNYDQQKIVLEPTDAPRWVRVGISPEAADGEIRVRAITPGSSAEEQGVKVGDTILEIDGRPVRLLGEVAELLQGAAGSQVHIKLRRGQETTEVTLERRFIP